MRSVMRTRDGRGGLMGEVQTVLGRVPAEALGVTLPHEHTRCVLWQIPNRWDYWQLTGDEDLMTAELARFAAVGGSGLVDVSLDAIGRDPARLAAPGFGERPAPRDGLRLVPPGLLPGRGAASGSAPSTTWPTSSSASSATASAAAACGPASSARSAPTSRG